MVTEKAVSINETGDDAFEARLPKGYKQTAVGVIPADWAVCRVGDVCRLVNGRGFKPFEWRKKGLPIIRIQNLNGSDEFNFFEGSYDSKLEIYAGQLLFAWSGSRGTSFGPHIWKGLLGLLNYHTWKVDTDSNLVVPDFFFHSLKWLTEYIESWAHGASALVHVQKWQMEGFQFALPPTKTEQEAIAAGLSDADALIESLEQLIVKKRQLKRGAMQELLTGENRLPGFEKGSGYKQTAVGVIPRDWDEMTVGQISEVKTGPFGSALHEKDYVNEGTPIITVEHLGERGVHHSNLPHVSDTDRTRLKGYSLRQGDIVFSRVGSVDRNALIKATEDGWLFSGRLLRVRPTREKIYSPYLSYQFHSEPFKQRVRNVAVGQTMASINTQILCGAKVAVPRSKAEQEAVGAILSDTDTEITALEEKLAKIRLLKHGMMQELLTGKVRLV